jgi:glycerol-3-phosphate O-acyltransferase
MVWSAMSMAAGVELDFTIAGDILRKGTVTFVRL